MATRKSLSKSARFGVFKRDGFRCMYCGAHPPTVILHVDHIHPVAEGGTNDIDNLITACEPCNLGKGARLLSEVPVSLADRAESIREQEDQLKGYNRALEERRARLENEAWGVSDIWVAEHGAKDMTRDKMRSIRSFLERLHASEVTDAMEKACERIDDAEASFKYFCGICWNTIRAAEARE